MQYGPRAYGFYMGRGWIETSIDAPSTKIPNINIPTLHENMKKHYKRWNDLFLKKIKEIEKILPIEKKSKNGELCVLQKQ